MTNEEAIEVIKSNWPSDRYTALREALTLAIKALKITSRKMDREAKNNEHSSN